jgi:hypothetical protein
VHVTPDGRDLKQLTQKFLLGAITYAQATDDYLDEGLSLDADNEEPTDDGLYTALEHNFDEAFGYFGAARHYLSFTDDEIAGASGRDDFKSGYHDANADGRIDLTSEYNFGYALNAAKRDRGSSDSAPTDFTDALFTDFVRGRHAIAAGASELGQRKALYDIRDRIVQNWEMVIVATVVHYINDTLKDMKSFGTDDYSFENHAKHWSELKGFALGLQFNPRKRLTNEAFATLHALLRTRPSLPGDDDNHAYAQALRDARSILVQFYEVDPSNIGGDWGEGGW